MARRSLNIDRQSILSEARWAHFVDARSVVVMAMRARGASFEHIGRALGRDHSSALHLYRTFGKRCARKPYLAAIAEQVAA
jgi:chromosomal replication initiation ATPase DnaA